MAAASEGAVEVERKYDAGEDAELPPLEGLPGVEGVDAPVEQELEAVYFDTRDLALAGRGITLRHRTGGEDAGWHLKLPQGPDSRREFREPLGGDPGQVPEPLLQWVRVHVREKALNPVARIRTRRLVHRLHGGDGVLAEVSDDRVQAEAAGGGHGTTAWREWEVELVDGDSGLLEAAEELFSDAGVRPAVHESKLARALGDRPLPAAPEPARPEAKGRAADVLLAYLHRQVSQLKTQDPLVRADEPDSIHQMRVATRRMRSVLATYRSLIDKDTANRLRVELRWLAGVLGEARDAEVMRERLADMLALEPRGLVKGPVARRVEEDLGGAYATAHAKVLKALDQRRYFRLLGALDSLLADPPLADPAAGPTHTVVPKLVKRDGKRLRRAVKATRHAAAEDSDEALHEARKSAKRLRYAAEAAAPVGGKRAERLADAAKQMQEILGDHHDSVVTREVLRRLGNEASAAGENAFSYGRLHALEQAMAVEAEARFRQAWKQFPSASLKT